MHPRKAAVSTQASPSREIRSVNIQRCRLQEGSKGLETSADKVIANATSVLLGRLRVGSLDCLSFPAADMLLIQVPAAHRPNVFVKPVPVTLARSHRAKV